MTWMLTASGQVVDLLRPSGAPFTLDDIAHHLAQINRFTGAARRPYSVAEHSLLVCEILEREHGVRDPSILLAGLMHDAHEAYTQDLSSPAKQAVGAAWGEFENRVQYALLRHHHLMTSYTAARKSIQAADLTALATERTALLPPEGPEWPVLKTHAPVSWANFERFASSGWEHWRDLFVLRYQALSQARESRAAEICGQALQPAGAAAIALCQRLVHPEDLGHAVTVEVRRLAREVVDLAGGLA